MRLAIIAPHFPEYTLRYAAAMSKRCTVLTCVDISQVEAEYGGRTVSVGGIQDIYMARFKTALDLLRLIVRVFRCRPVIVHFQEAVGFRRGVFNAVTAIVMRRFSKIALTIHDPTPHSGRDIATAMRTAWSRDYLRRTADIVVLHGNFCADQYRASCHGLQQVIVVSDHGVILAPGRCTPAPMVDMIKLYVFGRMEAYKGLDILLAAVEILHNQRVAFELLIEGRGVELDNLRRRFEALPEVKVFAGYVPSVQIIRAIQHSDCIVMPYLNATQSGVLASAFAGGRFVIASDVGGLSEVVVHEVNGLLVPAGDPAALAVAIRTAASDIALRQRLCEGARRCAATKLDWETIADAIMHQFEQICP